MVIAVVDDDPDLRDVVSEILRHAGYRPLPFPGAREALAGIRSLGTLPALILLDLMMPGMSGWDFRQEQLRDAALREVPVVVMTACRDLGRHPISADEILQKPVDVDTLLASIARHRN